MTQRPRVYVGFDAARSKNPAASDLKYYFLLRAWLARGALASSFDDVHADAPPGRPADMRRELQRRLQRSDRLLLILGPRSAGSAGWLDWEIGYAIDECQLPVLCTYPGRAAVDPLRGHPAWWPAPLRHAVHASAVPVRHARFRPADLAQALGCAPACGERPGAAIAASTSTDGGATAAPLP